MRKCRFFYALFKVFLRIVSIIWALPQGARFTLYLFTEKAKRMPFQSLTQKLVIKIFLEIEPKSHKPCRYLLSFLIFVKC